MPHVRANAADGAIRRTARVTTGPVSGTGEVDVTVTWPAPFRNGNYTVVAVVVLDEGGESLRVRRVRSVTAEAVVVNVANNSLTSKTGVVHAIAIA